MKATYWIGIHGSKVLKPEDLEAFEKAIHKKAAEMVTKLDGVQSAEISLTSGIAKLK